MATAESLVRLVILNNRQIEIDGIRYRLAGERDIRVVGAVRFGRQLLSMLAQEPVDLLLADKAAPAEPGDPATYDVFTHLPGLRKICPALKVAVIATQVGRVEARKARRRGGCGYLLRGDHETWVNLAQIVRLIASGSYFPGGGYNDVWDATETGPGGLTPRQLEILKLLATRPDMTTYAVALDLGVAHSTVRNLLSNAYLRLGVSTRAAAIAQLREIE